MRDALDGLFLALEQAVVDLRSAPSVGEHGQFIRDEFARR